MNRSEWSERLPLIQAFVEGKTIQVNYDGPWEDIDFEDVSFDSEIEHYRIKPEPKVIWVNEWPSGNYASFPTKEAAIEADKNILSPPLGRKPIRVAVKYVEMVE